MNRGGNKTRNVTGRGGTRKRKIIGEWEKRGGMRE